MESKSNFNTPGTSGISDFGVNRDAPGKVTPAAHSAVDKMADAAIEATRKIKPAVEGMADATHRTVDKAADVAGSAAEWASDKTADAKNAGKRLFADTCEYVSAQPAKSVAIAVVVGLLIGKVFL